MGFVRRENHLVVSEKKLDVGNVRDNCANDFEWRSLKCVLMYLNNRVLTLDTRRQALLLDVDDEVF